jgi:hypothetical protein
MDLMTIGCVNGNFIIKNSVQYQDFVLAVLDNGFC